jgi:hypothetical protein
MDKAHELVLAWALADSAAEHLSAEARVRLCTKIGAGELDSAIGELLAFFAHTQAELPDDLAASLRVWIRGYAGTERGPALLQLYHRIRVSAGTQTSRSEPAAKSRRLVARHHERATRVGSNRKTTFKRAIGQGAEPV